MLEEGCLPHEVDKALREFGLPMGIFQTSDLSGNLSFVSQFFKKKGNPADGRVLRVERKEKYVN